MNKPASERENSEKTAVWFLWVTAALVALLFIFIKVRNWGPSFDAPEQSDFGVYYYSAKISKIAPVYLYHHQLWIQASDGEFGYYMPFLYFPAYAVFLRPLGELSFEIARRVWFWGSVLAMIATGILMYSNTSSVRANILAAALWFFNPAVLDTLFLGQVNAFLAFILTLSCLGIGSSSNVIQFLAGMCLGLASVIKPFPIGLALYAFARKHYSYVAGVAVSIFLLIGAGIIVLPFQVTVDYFNVMFGVSAEYAPPGMPIFWNQSLAAFWSKLSIPIDIMINSSPPQTPVWAILLNAVSSLVLVWFTIKALKLGVKHGKGDKVLEISLILITMLLLTPYTWWHYLLITTFIFIAIAEILTRYTTTWWQRIAIPVGYILIVAQRAMERIVPHVRVSALSSLTMFGLLLWWICVVHTVNNKNMLL